MASLVMSFIFTLAAAAGIDQYVKHGATFDMLMVGVSVWVAVLNFCNAFAGDEK